MSEHLDDLVRTVKRRRLVNLLKSFGVKEEEMIGLSISDLRELNKRLFPIREIRGYNDQL